MQDTDPSLQATREPCHLLEPGSKARRVLWRKVTRIQTEAIAITEDLPFGGGSNMKENTLSLAEEDDQDSDEADRWSAGLAMVLDASQRL
jgi:hypothetical protein